MNGSKGIILRYFVNIYSIVELNSAVSSDTIELSVFIF